MTTKSRNELQADFSPTGAAKITAQDIRDFLASVTLSAESSTDDDSDLATSIGTVAADVTILTADLATLQGQVTQLAYVAPAITSLTNSVSVAEIGSTISAVTFSWTLNKSVTSQSIDGDSVTATARTDTKTVSLTSNTTFTLTADDGTSYTGHSTTATTNVLFELKRFWGVYATNDLHTSSTNTRTLSQEFATARGKSMTLDGAGKYLYYVYPASWGTASFVINGLPNTAWTLNVASFTNASGHAENYNFYSSNTVQNGTGISITIG